MAGESRAWWWWECCVAPLIVGLATVACYFAAASAEDLSNPNDASSPHQIRPDPEPTQITRRK